VEGTVQYQHPGEDWQDAKLNLPIQEGFALRTADGYAEVEFEDSMAIRLATNSTLEFAGLALQDGGRATRLTLSDGTAIISAKLRRGDTVSITASDLTVKLPRNGRFRVDASPTASWVSVFHGKVEVESQSGTAFVSSGHTLHTGVNGSTSTEVAANPPQDDFDKWVSHREDALNAAQSETSAVLGTNSYTEGYADLYNFGNWSHIPGYGAGWTPYGVGLGWMPFMAGQWQFMSGLGWNWVSGEPWGWLPYHFGSWVNAPGIGWAWLPVGSNTWMPATARWVNVNNHLGWIPNGPPPSSRPTKTQLAAVPSTVVLAGQEVSGAIRAGERLPLAPEGMSLQAASAPVPSFDTPTKETTQSTSLKNGPASPKTFAQSTAAPLSRSNGAPASLRGPSASTELQGARLSSIPHAMMAPHSAPAPSFARGASTSGIRGGFGAGSRGGSTGRMSTSTTAQGSTTGSASHSGGPMGSSSGHR
jgi:hypothetical protein